MKYLSNLTRPEGDPKILATGPSAVPGPDRLAKGLGWFSIGLGLTQLLAPHILTRTLGLRGREGLMRVFGAREIASGMLTLSTEKQTGMTSRVVGDLLETTRRTLHRSVAIELQAIFCQRLHHGAKSVRPCRDGLAQRQHQRRFGLPPGDARKAPLKTDVDVEDALFHLGAVGRQDRRQMAVVGALVLGEAHVAVDPEQ